MRFLIKNHLENAIEALRSNRLRTMLTITGVTIGTASIAAVLSLSGGAATFLSKQMIEVNSSVALVRSNATFTADNLLTDSHSLPAVSVLTEKDATDLTRVPNVTVAPMATLHTSLRAKEGIIDGTRATLVGSNSNLLTVAGLEVLDGQFFADDSSTSGIIMGNQLAIDLFGTEYALGSVVRIRGEAFTVMGTLKATNQPINYLGVDFDRSAIITTTALRQFTQNVAQIQQIVITANEPHFLRDAVEQSRDILLKNHSDEQDFMIMTGDDITAPSSQLFATSTIIIAVIAGIALLVGGIGIMNIMLVNVAERNREVGIRKAIGATNAHIVNQFLIESTIIGLTGGLLGYGLGMGAAYFLSMYLPFVPALEWRTAAVSIGVATLTGIVFGIYPAIRAARKDPIAALHQ